MSIASLLARIGTADPVEARQSMQELVDGFDISRFGRATPRFDPAELKLVNSRVLNAMPFEVAQARLEALDVGGGTGFWEAVRGNIDRLDDASALYRMATEPVTPVLDDDDVLKAAISALPDGEPDSATWAVWTKVVMEATGKKGKALFMPLRLALTGQASGPELAGLLPVMGRARILARLNGETA
jgi:glutamyl-tRNA synthetase